MIESISADVFGEHLGELASYRQWSEAKQAERTAFDAVPSTVNVRNPAYLNAQLSALETKAMSDEQLSALLLELGQQDDSFAPLHYRLGALASFSVLGTRTDEAPLSLSFARAAKEDALSISNDPTQRAKQIGDELNTLVSTLDSEEPVPIALVQNGYCNNCKIPDTRVISGLVEEPGQAIEVSAPEIIESNGSQQVSFDIPTVLRGISQITRYHGHHAWYPPEISSFSSSKNSNGMIDAPIPHLKQLTGYPSPEGRVDALYLGGKAVERIRHLPALDGPSAVSAPRSSRSRRPFRRLR